MISYAGCSTSIFACARSGASVAVLLISSDDDEVEDVAGHVFELGLRRNAGDAKDLADCDDDAEVEDEEEPVDAATENALTAIPLPLRRILNPIQANNAMAIACWLMNMGTDSFFYFLHQQAGEKKERKRELCERIVWLVLSCSS